VRQAPESDHVESRIRIAVTPGLPMMRGTLRLDPEACRDLRRGPLPWRVWKLARSPAGCRSQSVHSNSRRRHRRI